MKKYKKVAVKTVRTMKNMPSYFRTEAGYAKSAINKALSSATTKTVRAIKKQIKKTKKYKSSW